jgi:hypothetical protein
VGGGAVATKLSYNISGFMYENGDISLVLE